jgi:hypothetical protein
VWFTGVTFNLYEWDNKTFLNYLCKKIYITMVVATLTQKGSESYAQGSDSKWSKQDPDEHRYILVS